MKHLLIGITTAIAVAATGQVLAQVPAPGPQQAQWAPPAPAPALYPLNAPTPRDAYRQGLINRWELEQLTGPEPQALQGPSVDGERGDSDGGGRQ
jgi:hypothetical protein